MKKLSLIIALMTFMATAWAQNSTNVGSESELRSKLSNSQYDGYTINLTSTITVHSQLEVSHINTINMNGKSIVAESAATRIFHVKPQGSLPYIPSLTLTGNGTLSGGGATDGGAIYNEGMLTLQNVTIQNCTASAKGGAIYSKGTLTMNGGSITGNTAGNGAAINLYGGTFTMTGGTISGNSTIVSDDANKNCGGVNLTGNSTMTMSGGSIADNISLNKDGGVYIGSGCTFNMTGGSITGNSAAANYGGIRVDGVFNMSGGSISGNTATDSFGGIGVDESGTLNLTGGSITGNNATNNYGGIWINGTLNMSGNPIVSGNLAANSTASNVYLRSGKTITVNGAFTGGANIHVTHADGLDANGYRDFATGYATYNATTNPATVFRSDNAAYEVGLHSDNGAASLIAATHLYDVPYLNVDATGDYGIATRATCIMMSSFDPNSPVTLNDNYWYVVDQDLPFSERISINSGTVNLILMDNTTLTANKGIFVPYATTLHIWAQSTKSMTDDDHMGIINATSNTTWYSGIGGSCDMNGGSDAGILHFHGGGILATGGEHAAGIHGTPLIGSENYSIYIYGGQIFGMGGDEGAGIGGCRLGVCGGIMISGGSVSGIGGSHAAGIGSGYMGKMHPIDGIYSMNPSNSDVTEIRITGGTVVGLGTTGAGIGGGEGYYNANQTTYDGDPAVVYIDGGTVIAQTQCGFSLESGLHGRINGAVAIGWGRYGMDGYNFVHIYDGAKVLASTTIDGTPTLQSEEDGRGRGDNWRRFKQMEIYPCDHPNQGISYYDDNGYLATTCNCCYSHYPYTFEYEGNWSDNSNWFTNRIPSATSHVLVKKAATIPNGCIAQAADITLEGQGNLTIADGGQLLHSNAGVQATVKKSITGHGGNNNGGWYFIASPTVDSLAPTNVANMTTSSYDLYYYHEPTSKWRNYKPAQGNADPGFKIAPQQGYLYAKENTTTLSMTGTLRPSHEAVTIKGLSHAASSPLTGFNLVGNPFACNATVSGSCYTIQMENNKQVIKAAIDPTVGPCEGVMVQVTAENDSVTFTRVTPATQSNQPNNGSLQITLSQVPEPVVAERGRSVEGPARNQVGVSTGSTTLALDNAIITFNEGNQLGKFYLGEQNANIYIPQDGEAYAIACVSDSRDGMHTVSTNEMPLNFKAKADGTYTITVNPEGVEMGYLHLIDNMTGADVDLLAAGPSTGSGASYTFTAKTTDYESRFKLVFSANGEDGPSTGSGAFAYVNNGEIIITGVVGDACNASLQVIDVTGRIIRRRDALNASSASLPTTGMAPGVYVLRLINGNDVKVQKMVIE